MRQTLTRGDLEGLFRRGEISRGQFVRALLAAGTAASGVHMLLGSDALPVEAQSATAQYLVLIVLDAFRPDYMQLAPMPNLQALLHTGISYDRAWVAQLESETPTGHATISTGSVPKHTGVIGFEWRDPTSRREVLDGWAQGVLNGRIEMDLRGAGASSIPLAVKAADPRSTVVALSSEKVYAADAMGGWAADYILYHHRGTGSKANYLVPDAVPGHTPPAEFFQLPQLSLQLPLKHFTDWDYLSTMLALRTVADVTPRVLMVNLPGADYYGHPYGGPATPGVMKQVVTGLDRNIGRIVNAYQRAGIFDQTLFVITADHGMVPNDRSVDGSITKAAVKQAGGKYLFHTGGTAADIYLADSSAGALVAEQMAQLSNVSAAYYQVASGGTYTYQRATNVPIDPALDAAYQYLLGTFAGPTAPDVVAPFRENTIGTKSTNAHGDHGGLNWGAQHVPLIMTGPGVRSGVLSHSPARLTDVAPTVLRLMGLQSVAMDGIVLADALVSPSADEVHAQSSLRKQLLSYQDALIAMSQSDIAQDHKDGLKPPPPMAERP